MLLWANRGSHWWGEPIRSFVTCCKRHAHFRSMGITEAKQLRECFLGAQHPHGWPFCVLKACETT